jgi:hypothetical protein
MRLGGIDVVSARLTGWVIVAACAVMPTDVIEMAAKLRKDIVNVLKRIRGGTRLQADKARQLYKTSRTHDRTGDERIRQRVKAAISFAVPRG